MTIEIGGIVTDISTEPTLNDVKKPKKLKEIKYNYAKTLLSGLSVYSDRVGNYFISKDAPNDDFYPIVSPPIGSRFMYDRTTGDVIFYVGGQLMNIVKTNKS